MQDSLVDRVQRERDFYRRLLQLGNEDAIERLMHLALTLIVEETGTLLGYLCLQQPDDVAPRWSIAHHYTDKQVEEIQYAVSTGIIAETLRNGEIVHTASAAQDVRFKDQPSVAAANIDAVVCVPLGRGTPLGTVYLQRKHAFEPDHIHYVEFFAQVLTPLADRLLARKRRAAQADYTATIRVKFACPGIIGCSQALARALNDAALVAPLDLETLIIGPSGSGKTMVGRAIHHNSPRAQAPYVEINCATIPDSLLENELFGAEKGAHSGAASGPVEGKVAVAEGGTLFLDEIATLTAHAQAKLLTLIQEKTYYPLGAARERVADIRIIAATNANLKDAVAQRTFREDLYHRLHLLPIRMPSLEDRRDDIPLLVQHFCERAARKYKLELRLSHSAICACQEANWPGHVRELHHTVVAGALRAHRDGRDTIEQHHLFPMPDEINATVTPTLREATLRFRGKFILDLLEATEWDIAESAKRLGVARSHIYNLINAHGLKRGE